MHQNRRIAVDCIALPEAEPSRRVTLGRYVVPLVFFTWKRFWNQHRVGDGQEPDWLPVTGASLTQWLLD